MNAPDSPGYLKCCLHAHTRERNPYTPVELIGHAKKSGYDVLAITEHDEVYFPDDARREADRQGILLLPSIEVSVDGRGAHVLFLNVSSFPKCRMSMDDLRAWWYGEADRDEIASVAPHPFYPGRICLNGQLRRNMDMFDAVEFSRFDAPFSNWLFGYPNSRAVSTALEFDKAVIGTGDVHRLWHLGTTYSLVKSENEPGAIVRAIKESRFDDCRIEYANGYHEIYNGNVPGKTIIVKARPLGKIETGMEFASAARDFANIF